jgi:hypothetical protein
MCDTVCKAYGTSAVTVVRYKTPQFRKWKACNFKGYKKGLKIFVTDNALSFSSFYSFYDNCRKFHKGI